MAKQTSASGPEKEHLAGRGAKAVVWLNPNGRAITISPPRFKDENGTWKDGSFFVTDLPMLIYALQQTLDYCYQTPMPSQDNDPVN